MGILQVLAELEQPALVTLGDVNLRVGESDRDAAVALLAFMDEYIEEGETTYSQVEDLLVLNFLEAMQAAIKGRGSMPCRAIMEDQGVRTMLDCLWWFRFLMASRPEDDDAKPCTEEDRLLAAGSYRVKDPRTGEWKAAGEI